MFSTQYQRIVRSILYIQQNLAPRLVSPGNTNERSISTSNVSFSNYYEALGITSSSTQSEIKAAYYKLSMIYHPDKNQGSESAAKKFREISQAYEVLSNYRLRRLYDKGVISSDSPFEQPSPRKKDAEDPEDDPQTKFYKSRFTKSKVADTYGQNPIYDFDEWTKSHYGKSFGRKQNAKQRWERKTTEKKANAISLQKEIMIFGLVLSFTVFYLIVHADQSYYDTPRDKEKKNND